MRDAVEDFKRLIFDPYRRARRVNRVPDIINMGPVEKDGRFVLAHSYWIYFLEGAQDFSTESLNRWGNLIGRIFELMQRADAGDQKAKDNLKAVEKTVFADLLGIN